MVAAAARLFRAPGYPAGGHRALETAHSSALARLRRGAGELARALAEALTAHGLPQAEAPSLATLTLAGIEGALIMARAERAVARSCRCGPAGTARIRRRRSGMER
jgi:hypothetical protein